MVTEQNRSCVLSYAGAVVCRDGNQPRMLVLTARRWSPSTVLTCVVALSAAALLPACSPVPSLPPAPMEPPPGAGYVTNLPPYHIQVGDILSIRLLLNKELDEDVTVRPDGHISTTVVNDQVAYGLTVPQLAAALRADYSKQLTNPILTVVVKAFAPTRIYVAGEVNNPGEFIDVGPNLTLSQAIARAGGVKTMTADEDKVFIIRRGLGDVPQFLSVRFDAVENGTDPQADVRLAPYDVVYVPRTGVTDVYRFVYTHFLQFVPVSWGFSYVVNNTPGTTVVAPH
jgi:polysaccharide biosynthesis/export protein